jgi:hypothetical protein
MVGILMRSSQAETNEEGRMNVYVVTRGKAVKGVFTEEEDAIQNAVPGDQVHTESINLNPHVHVVGDDLNYVSIEKVCVGTHTFEADAVATTFTDGGGVYTHDPSEGCA